MGKRGLRRARDVSTDYSVRTHAEKNALGSVVTTVESRAPAGRACGRWFGRMKHCGAAPAAQDLLLAPSCATLRVHLIDGGLVHGWEAAE